MIPGSGRATHSNILACRIPEDPGGLQPRDCKESDTTELTLSFLMNFQESEFGNYYVEIHRKANPPLPIKAKTRFVCRSLNETEIRKYVNLCHLGVLSL